MTAVLDPPAVAVPGTVDRPARPEPTVPSRWRGLWWANPAGALLLVVPVSLAVTTTISARDYTFFYRVEKAVTHQDVVLFLVAGTVLLLGTALPLVGASSTVRRPLDDRQLATLERAAGVAFALTVLGYVAFAVIGVARGATPALLLHVLTSQSNYGDQVKTLFAPVAGVTSLTQVGIAYVVLAGVLRAHGRGRRTGRRLTVVLLLGLVRAYFLTERLAILELLVPLVVTGAVSARQRRGSSRLLVAVPVLALPLLAVVFGAFEYSRSWQYFKTRTTLSFPSFVVNRLAGYYATSYNNGSLQLRYGQHLHELPYESVQGFWTSPGPAQLDLYHRLTGSDGGAVLNTVLAQHGNPEFNNPGGLAEPLFDFGVAGGLLFFLVFGLLIGFAYRSFRTGGPAGLLLYPVLFTGLLELPRYVYWTEGRVVPAYVVLGVTVWLLRRRRAER